VGCYMWYSEEGTGRGHSPLKPLLAVPNVTARFIRCGTTIAFGV